MFESLIASRPTWDAGVHRYLLAIAMHGAAAVAAVAATGARRDAESLPPLPPPAIFAPPAHRTAPPHEAGPEPGALPAPPAVPQGLAVPLVGPPELPTRAPSVSGLLAMGTDPGSALPTLLPAGDDRKWGEPFEVQSVDEPVEIMHQPTPRFPPALAGAGIGGRVELEYVVDTAGRAEPGSLRTLASAHPAFEEAARASVLAARYRPARAGGRVVRQLVRQTLSFRPVP